MKPLKVSPLPFQTSWNSKSGPNPVNHNGLRYWPSGRLSTLDLAALRHTTSNTVTEQCCRKIKSYSSVVRILSFPSKCHTVRLNFPNLSPFSILKYQYWAVWNVSSIKHVCIQCNLHFPSRTVAQLRCNKLDFFSQYVYFPIIIFDSKKRNFA